MARGVRLPSSTRAATRCAGRAASSTTTRSTTPPSSQWPKAAPPGSDRLLFLPYLNGERFGGDAKPRGEFFGLASGHNAGYLHRGVMEGVAFAARRSLTVLEHKSGPIDSIVAAAGGAHGLWLDVRASVYDRPIVVPAQAEAGVAGCAMIAALLSVRSRTGRKRAGDLSRSVMKSCPILLGATAICATRSSSASSTTRTDPCGRGSMR
jgi:sugar (pentulose or hexulose) kinase